MSAALIGQAIPFDPYYIICGILWPTCPVLSSSGFLKRLGIVTVGFPSPRQNL